MAENRFPISEEIRILLVSRNKANRTALESMLSFGAQKFITTSRTSLIQAEKSISTTNFDLILLCSYDSEEKEFLDFISRHSYLPIVVINKYYNKVFSDRIFSSGARDYLDLSTLDSRLLLKSINFSLQQHETAVRAQNAQRRMELRSSFITNMSHEIRTPLNSIIGFSELLFEDETDAVKREKLNMIRQSGKHLLTLINSILDFSKLEAGKIILEEVEFSLDSLIQNLYYMMLVKSGNKNIDLNIKPLSDIPYLVYGDKFRLNQVLINLMNNAIKFTETGSVTLEYKFEKGRSVISIIDTGIGIPADQIDHIFNAFEQVNSPLTSSESGTGLGLAISKSLVDLMGGTISVKSTPDSGSNFTISIPLKVTKQHTQTTDKQVKNNFPTRIIAVLYNDPKELIMMQSWCERKGYKAKFFEISPYELNDEIYSYDLILIPQDTYRNPKSKLFELLNHDSRSAFKPVILFASRNDRLFFLISKNSLKTLLVDRSDKILDKNFTSEELINAVNKIFEKIEQKGNKLFRKWKNSFEQENPGLEGILPEAVSRFHIRQQELNLALKNNDYRQIEDIAHSLKGFTGQTCMYEVSNRASILLNEMRKQIESPHPEVIKREISALNEIIWLMPSEVLVNKEITYKLSNNNDKINNLKILVAEDNSINQAVINEYLAYFGQSCDIVSNGKQALQKLAEKDYNLLFLDVQMPVMNGLETLKEIRSNPQLDRLYVAVITAFLSDNDGLEFLSEKANSFISKPFEKKDVKAVLDLAVIHNENTRGINEK